MKKFILFILSFIILIALGIWFAVNLLYKNIGIDKDTLVEIAQKATISECIEDFNEKGLLKPYWFFRNFCSFFSKFTGKQIYSGTYKFTYNQTNIELIISIFSGKNRCLIKVTYPEGINLYRFASINKKMLDLDSAQFISLAFDKHLLEHYGIRSLSLEGYLHPVTYNFPCNVTNEKLIDILIKQQDKIWKSEFKKSADSLGKSRQEILTLASIIEAESPDKEENFTMSGVYYNSLNRGWKLDADPTVAYITNKKGRLLHSDLKKESAFNTYTNYGLPPGPINSPSTSSIKAALFPNKHKFMFFVAKGDNSGKHLFAENYNEHLRNVAKYKKARKSGG